MPEPGKQAPYEDGVPLVESTLERDYLFPAPATAQRVQYPSGTVERYTGTTWIMLSTTPTFDVRRYGILDSADDDDTLAAANVAAMRTLTDLASAYRYSRILFPEIATGRAYWFGNASVGAVAAIHLPPGCTLQNDAVLKRQAFATGRFVAVNSECTVENNGTIDGNSDISAARVAGTDLLHQEHPTLPLYGPGGRLATVWIKGKGLWTRPTAMSVNLIGVDGVSAEGLVVRSIYGSVDAAEPDDVSGDNNDGLHFYNCSKVVVSGCDIEAVDDCIAFSFLSTYGTDDYESFKVLHNTCRNRVAENVAAPGLGGSGTAGTLARYLGGGLRVTDEAITSGLTARDVLAQGNTFIGGQFGVTVGSQTTTTERVVSSVRLMGNTFLRTGGDGPAADYDTPSAGPRALKAAIFAGTTDDLEIRDNTFEDLGYTAILLRQVRRVRITGRNIIRDLDTTRSDLAVTGSAERAAIRITNNPATLDTDDVLIEDVEATTLDGAFLHISKEAGAGVLRGIRIRGNRISGHNTSGLTTAHGAAYSLRNGGDGSSIVIDEFDGADTVATYNAPLSGSATELSVAVDRSRSILVAISEWSSAYAGAAKFFAPYGTLTATTADYTGPEGLMAGALTCDGVAADGISTAAYGTDTPFAGRALRVTVSLLLLEGSIKIGNLHNYRTFTPEYTPRWREYEFVFPAAGGQTVGVDFQCVTAASFVLGPLKVELLNRASDAAVSSAPAWVDAMIAASGGDNAHAAIWLRDVNETTEVSGGDTLVTSVADARGATGFGPAIGHTGANRPTKDPGTGDWVTNGTNTSLRVTSTTALKRITADCILWVVCTVPAGASGNVRYFAFLDDQAGLQAAGLWIDPAGTVLRVQADGAGVAPDAGTVVGLAGYRVLFARRVGDTTLGGRIGSGVEDVDAGQTLTALGDVRSFGLGARYTGTGPIALSIAAAGILKVSDAAHLDVIAAAVEANLGVTL